jgi:Ca-activated chloride channel homolog
MRQPHVELIPLRPAVRSDAPVTLDVLIKITPPAAELNAPRPALNLGLVLEARRQSTPFATTLD